MPPVATVRDEMIECNRRLQDLVAVAEKEDRDFSPAESAEKTALVRRMQLLADRMPRADTFDQLLRDVRASATSPPPPSSGGAPTAGLLSGSAGQAFVFSDEFKALQARWPMSGPRSPVVVEIRAALTSPTPGWASGTQLPPVPPPVPVQMPRVSELFLRAEAAGGNVPFVTDASTGTAGAQTEGAAKSEITLVAPSTIMPVRTVAAWAKASDQSLEDIGALASWIDAVLASKVLTELDRQCIAGSGVAPNLLGLLNVTGRTADYAMPGTGSDPATALLHQILAVEQASGFAVDAVVLAPDSYERLMNLKATTAGTYLSGNPISASPMQLLWGRTMTVSAALAAGTALVGSFRQGAGLFVRGGLRLALTNSDASDFTANISTLRAELRAALCTWVPKAFGLVTALAP